MYAPTHLFDKTIAITRPTISKDSGGSPIETFSAHLSGLACRIQPISANENVKAGRPASATTFRIYLASGQDIDASDQITYGSRTLKIIEPMRDYDEQSILSVIVAEEVEP